MQADWYSVAGIDHIDSPGVVLYTDRMEHNLEEMIRMVGGDVRRLRPHLKTNKMPGVVKRMIGKGLSNFKTSTIAEAEMAAASGAGSVLIAHQLTGPKIARFSALSSRFPETSFYTIIDNEHTLRLWEQEAVRNRSNIAVYIDVNNGMNRSGIEPGPELELLARKVLQSGVLELKGLHVYDGHHRDADYERRKKKLEAGFSPLEATIHTLKKDCPQLEIISGGTPAFTTHALHKDRVCSPGTCVFWDWGYGEKLPEQKFKHAVLLVTRVISKPAKGLVTIDLGHKAVASENPVDQRIKFLNLDRYELLSQSEEHGVLRVDDPERLQIGDVLYGVPYHICPTINLYDEITVTKEGEKTGVWEITARKRRITV